MYSTQVLISGVSSQERTGQARRAVLRSVCLFVPALACTHVRAPFRSLHEVARTGMHCQWATCLHVVSAPEQGMVERQRKHLRRLNVLSRQVSTPQMICCF